MSEQDEGQTQGDRLARLPPLPRGWTWSFDPDGLPCAKYSTLDTTVVVYVPGALGVGECVMINASPRSPHAASRPVPIPVRVAVAVAIANGIAYAPSVEAVDDEAWRVELADAARVTETPARNLHPIKGHCRVCRRHVEAEISSVPEHMRHRVSLLALFCSVDHLLSWQDPRQEHEIIADVGSAVCQMCASPLRSGYHEDGCPVRQEKESRRANRVLHVQALRGPSEGAR